MIDIQSPLRALFFTILQGENIVSYENGAVPDDAVKPYVILSSMDSSEESNKSDFGNTVRSLFDIVTEFDRNTIGGSAQADTIAGVILAKINSKTKLDIATEGLQIVNTKVIQDQKLSTQTPSTQTPTKSVFRRLIRFENLIMQV